jgi:hypothetical protein
MHPFRHTNRICTALSALSYVTDVKPRHSKHATRINCTTPSTPKPCSHPMTPPRLTCTYRCVLLAMASRGM